MSETVKTAYGARRTFAWCAFISAAVFAVFRGYNFGVLLVSTFSNVALLNILIIDGIHLISFIFMLSCLLLTARSVSRGHRTAAGIVMAALSAATNMGSVVYGLALSGNFRYVSVMLSLITTFVIAPIWMVALPLCAGQRPKPLLAGTGALMAVLNVCAIFFSEILYRMKIMAAVPDMPFWDITMLSNLMRALSECLFICFAAAFLIASAMRKRNTFSP